jgi:5-methylthioadenosine/S-adenosylhomocysteine deaminase
MIEPIVFQGRLVTFDDGRVIDDGALYIGADEKIAAVQKADDPAPAGFDDARRIETGGAIYPGLIDLHGHMIYNCLSLWSPAGRTEPYTSRYEWPDAHDYEARISDPANALGALAGKALLKYVEVKAAIGGTTAVQGSAKMAYPYEGWLVRNVEYETFKTKKKSVYQSALPLKDDGEYAKDAKRMKEGKAFIYHLAEGTDPQLVSEYTKLHDEDCLQPTLGAIHCTALNKATFGEWGPHGGAVIWSPFSNLWLYRDTTRADQATEAGLRVCLGADWSPSGSKNLLGELKVADLWNRTHLKGAFSDRQLCEMATANPADALNWGTRLGRLKAGLHGDLLVTSERHADPYRNLIEAVERDVLLVAINGQPFYGTTALIGATGAARAEPIQVGRLRRRVILVYPEVKDADMGWKEVLADIEKAKKDPVKRYLEIEELHELGKPPPWLKTDKPWDDPTGKKLPVDVYIPPLDPLNHNSAYFKAIAASPLHGGALDPLRDYYEA